MPESNDVVLLLGSNEGTRVEYLSRAMELLELRVGRVERRSQLYRSEAWGYESNNFYLNQTLVIQSSLSPDDLLHATQGIENDLGRVRMERIRYSDRTIDIDILYYNDLVMDSADLQIPHPRLSLRLFVLEPLAEILPDFRHPVNGMSSVEMLARLK